MCKVAFIMLVILSTLLFNTSMAQDNETFIKVKKTEDFELDGSGRNKHWEKTEWIKLEQRSNTEKVNYVTACKLLYSESGIYALYQCEDKNITSTLTKDNDDLYNEDVVEIFFWTDEQYPLYFEYELSPLNYELVLLVPNHEGKFLGWNPWHYEGDRKTKHFTQIQREKNQVTGWSAEFFIPFKLMAPLNHVPPVIGSKWRANMYRIDYDRGMATWSWLPTRKNFHDYKSFGTLVFD